MSSESNSNIRIMNHQDLDLVLCWRNHHDVRPFMYSQHEIARNEHEDWFHKMSEDPATHALIFEIECNPCGFVQFKVMEKGRVAEWGFYLGPNAPRGAGRKLGRKGLDYAFGSLGCNKVRGQALAHNDRSIRFHLLLGFREEELSREHYCNDERYHDVVQFGLTKAEWQQVE